MAEELGRGVPGPLSGMQSPLGWGVAEEGHVGDGLVRNLPATSAAPLRHPHGPSRSSGSGPGPSTPPQGAVCSRGAIREGLQGEACCWAEGGPSTGCGLLQMGLDPQSTLGLHPQNSLPGISEGCGSQWGRGLSPATDAPQGPRDLAMRLSTCRLTRAYLFSLTNSESFMLSYPISNTPGRVPLAPPYPTACPVPGCSVVSQASAFKSPPRPQEFQAA